MKKISIKNLLLCILKNINITVCLQIVSHVLSRLKYRFHLLYYEHTEVPKRDIGTIDFIHNIVMSCTLMKKDVANISGIKTYGLKQCIDINGYIFVFH